MEVIRTVGNYKMNKGEGTARGLYNISNTKNNNELSVWFDRYTKDEFMQLSDKEFEQMAKDFCKE